MDTVSHGVWTYIIMHRYPRRWYFVLGAVFPDIAIISIAVSMLLRGDLSLSPPWLPKLYSLTFTPTVDSVLHSVVIWTAVLAAAQFLRWENIKWFVYGVYSHIIIDILTHQQFLPKYIFPLSRLTISGIVDYRTLWFTVIDLTLIIGVILWLRRLKRYT